MIRTRIYDDGVCSHRDVDPKDISDHLKRPGAVVWMDLCQPDHDQLALIAEEFGLNPLAVEDAQTGRQRPKLDRYDDHAFIALYDVGLDRTSGEITSTEISVFAAPHYLITVRRSAAFDIDTVVKRWDDNADLAKHGVGFLLWGLLDVVVDSHFTSVDELDSEIEALEDLLFDDDSPTSEVQRRSFQLRKSLVLMRRVVLPTREVVNALMRREAHVVDETMLPYYQDVYDHVLRATDWTDSLRDLVSTILETNLTIQGNRLNEVMKKVTSWAAIIGVPTAITGYYGMNVRIYPIAGSTVGGIVALVLIIGTSFALWLAFRSRGWL